MPPAHGGYTIALFDFWRMASVLLCQKRSLPRLYFIVTFYLEERISCWRMGIASIWSKIADACRNAFGGFAPA
jgi:hypothetical protein